MVSDTLSAPTATSCPRTSCRRPSWIQMFCDVVSKNGNLLHRRRPPVPTAPSPRRSRRRCAGWGAWLESQRRGHLRKPALGGVGTVNHRRDAAALHQERRGRLRPHAGACQRSRRITLPAVDGSRVGCVRLVGADVQLEWSVEASGDLSVTLPEQLPDVARDGARPGDRCAGAPGTLLTLHKRQGTPGPCRDRALPRKSDGRARSRSGVRSTLACEPQLPGGTAAERVSVWSVPRGGIGCASVVHPLCVH